MLYSTQKEQIERATRAYIMPLGIPNSKGITERYSIYLLDDMGELDVLWPGDKDRYDDQGNDLKKPRLLPHQCFDKNSHGRYPAYHFRLSGYGYSKTLEIKSMLIAVNPKLIVATIRGWSPSMSSMD